MSILSEFWDGFEVPTVVDGTVAKEEFGRFVRANRIWVEDDSMDEDAQKELESSLKRILRGIQIGKITIDDSGTITAHLNSIDFTFHPLTGKNLMVLDKYSEAENVHRAIQLIAKLTRKPPRDVEALETPDFNLLQAILGFFLVR